METDPLSALIQLLEDLTNGRAYDISIKRPRYPTAFTPSKERMDQFVSDIRTATLENSEAGLTITRKKWSVTDKLHNKFVLSYSLKLHVSQPNDAETKAQDTKSKAHEALQVERAATCVSDWIRAVNIYWKLKDSDGMRRCAEGLEPLVKTDEEIETCALLWEHVAAVSPRYRARAHRCRKAHYKPMLERMIPLAPPNVVEDVATIASRKQRDTTPCNDFLRAQLFAYVRHRFTDYDQRLHDESWLETAIGGRRKRIRKELHDEVQEIIYGWYVKEK